MDYAALLKAAITQKDSKIAKQAMNPVYSGVDMAVNTPYVVPQYGKTTSAAVGDAYTAQQVPVKTTPLSTPTGNANTTLADVNTPSVTTPITPAPYQAPQAVDNSGMINTQYGDLITALKAQIQQSVNDKNLSIGGLGNKYQPDKNASEVAKYGQVSTLNEQAANAGDRGGIGRQNTLQAMIGGENRLNTINLQQTSEKTALQNDIANLVLSGNIQEAQFSAQKLQDLIANSTNMDNTNYQRGQDTANQTGYLSNGQTTLAKQQIDTQNAQWDKTYAMNKSAADLNNALSQLNIDTAKLNLAALPQQIQDQATMVTQQIIKGNIDIDTGRAQLKELTDPNSLTNQMNKLGLDTAKFNYTQLPVQAQQQAQQVANDLANGAMSRAQAQSSIDHAGDSAAASQNSLDWAKSKDNPSNWTSTKDPNANTAADFASVINAQFMAGGTLDSAGVKSYLVGLMNSGVDSTIIDSLAARYGITAKDSSTLFQDTANNALR